MATDDVLSPTDILLRRDLVDEGWTDRQIARAVRGGDLTRLRWGAYVPSGLVDPADELAMARARSRAVLRTAHPTSVLSHQSALAEYGVAMWGVDLTQTHLTRTDRKAGRRETGVVHHRGVLDDAGWKTVNGVPVVSPARATLEVVVDHGLEAGLVAACGALSGGLVTHDGLRGALADTERWPGSLGARMVVSRASARLTNVAEARCWHLFHEWRLPRPEPQVAVHDEVGDLVGIVDVLWRAHGVFLEFDGRVKYVRHRREGESLEDYLMREKRRQEVVGQLTGWVPVRIGWAALETPARTARRLGQLLESRRTDAA